MRLCVVQTVLPLYSISFFNRIVELYPVIELIVLADVVTKHNLNQYDQEICQFKVVQLNNIDIKGIALRPGILKTLSDLNPDIIVFSGSVRDLGQFLAMFVCRFKRIPFAAWGMFHRVGKPRLISSVYFKIVALLADRCLTYSRVGAVNLISHGVNKKKIAIIGTAIDEQAVLSQISSRTQKEISAFQIDARIENKKLILQVVRLSRVKRPELFIYAAFELIKKRDDLIFAVIGDGEMREELEELIYRHGLQDKFRFIGSLYDERLLSFWFLSAKVFVVPTFIGLSAHHAMIYGIPVVTDDSLDGQGSEFSILANGLNSMSYREGDSGDLARVIEMLVDDAELHATISINARRTIEMIYNLNKKTHNFINEVQKISNRKKIY